MFEYIYNIRFMFWTGIYNVLLFIVTFFFYKENKFIFNNMFD